MRVILSVAGLSRWSYCAAPYLSKPYLNSMIIGGDDLWVCESAQSRQYDGDIFDLSVCGISQIVEPEEAEGQKDRLFFYRAW